MRAVSLSRGVVHTIDRGEGRPLLLVHGFPLDHRMWSGQIDTFANHCRVIAPDLPGFGRSPPQAGVDSMEGYADVLHELIGALDLGEPLVYCGLSMGGYVGWQFWRKYRHRLAGLIQCDTRAIADTPAAAKGRFDLIEKVRANGAMPVAEAMIPKLFAPRTTAEFPDVVEATRQIILATPPEGLIAALRAMAARPDVTELLPTIETPTLLVVGEHDAISTVDEMRGIADQIPESRWLVAPLAGHMTPLENAVVFNDGVMEFVAELPRFA